MLKVKPKEVEVTYSNEGIEYLIMNISVKALSVKLMQPIRCVKNRFTPQYFTYSGLPWVSSWYHLGKQMQINGGSVSAFTFLPQN